MSARHSLPKHYSHYSQTFHLGICSAHTHCPFASHLSLLIDTNDSRSGFVRSSYKDGLSTDSVHVNTHSRLQVVQVNVTILCDQVYHAMLTTNLRRIIRKRNIQEWPIMWWAEYSRSSLIFFTCIATGKSVWASGGKNTSTAFLANGWFPAAGWPTSMMCNW